MEYITGWVERVVWAVMDCNLRAWKNEKSSFLRLKVSKILNWAGIIIKLIGFNGACVTNL